MQGIRIRIWRFGLGFGMLGYGFSLFIDTGGTNANCPSTIIEKSSRVCGLDAYPGSGEVISRVLNVIEDMWISEQEKSCHDYLYTMQYELRMHLIPAY